MRLIEIASVEAGLIYVNPDHVLLVSDTPGGGCYIALTHGEAVRSNSGAPEIADRLRG